MGQDYVHVVIGIIQNSKQQILLSRRKLESHLGGLLEFPGGKVEKNESPVDALRRELFEELKIEISDISQLIQVPYCYTDRKVLLDAYLINKYTGGIIANEVQDIQWEFIHSLDEEQFPAANHGVLKALTLPKLFAVTPDYSDDINFIENFKKVVGNSNIEVIQLRSHSLNDSAYKKVLKLCAKLCVENNVKLFANRGDHDFRDLGIAGTHLTSKKLLTLKSRPLDKEHLIGASCHNLQEIEYANKLNLDYIFIGPVLEKHQNKNRKTLGWSGFSELTKLSQIPAYAIGGMLVEDAETSIQHGGQGVAAIRDLWYSQQ